MSQAPFALGPELTIAFAAGIREQLAVAVAVATAPAGPFTLDLSGVSEFDSAGLQLLLATRRSLAAAGRPLRLQAPSAVVRDALQVFGLHRLLAEAA